uniref:Cystatin domain-containing protein n=1 Tax=Nothobranchius furzeri TaxID=105023 RepID=A0A8C6NNQ8_NOTFU
RLILVFTVKLTFFKKINALGPANETDVQEVLSFFTIQHNIGTNDIYLHQVREVVHVQAQVVEGTNYILTVNMARSTCKKDDANKDGAKDEECVIQTEPTLAHSYQCKFSVWRRPWLNDTRLVEHKC